MALRIWISYRLSFFNSSLNALVVKFKPDGGPAHGPAKCPRVITIAGNQPFHTQQYLAMLCGQMLVSKESLSKAISKKRGTTH